MTLKQTQAKPGYPRTVSPNRASKTGRPDHPSVLDTPLTPGEVGSLSTNYPNTNNPNRTKGRGGSDGMGLAGVPGRSNTGYIAPGSGPKPGTNASADRVKKIGN